MKYFSVTELKKKGFQVSLYQDMSDDWSKVARDRIASYINNKERHIIMPQVNTHTLMSYTN